MLPPLDPHSTQVSHLHPLAAFGAGLQAKLYRVGRITPSSVFFKDPDYEKLRKSLDKNFPRRDVKERGWDKLAGDPNRARQVLGEMAFAYDAVKEVARFQEAAVQSLKRSTMLLSAPPTYAPHYDALLSSEHERFMDLLTVLAKVLIQLGRMAPEMRSATAAFNAAHFILNANHEEDSFFTVSAFLTKYYGGVDPLQITFRELTESGEAVGEVVSQILDRVAPFFLLSSSGGSGAFAGSSSAAASGASSPASSWMTVSTQAFQEACLPSSSPSGEDVQPSSLSICLPVMGRERYREWIVYTLLLVPTAILVSSSASATRSHEGLLRRVLSESVVIGLCREETLRVHDAFHELFAWFPPKEEDALRKRLKDALGNAKLQKFVTEAATEATNRAALVHRERRALLTQALHAAAVRLTDLPGTAGPTFPSLLALLATSRDEIYWYLSHVPSVCAPPKIQGLGLLSAVTGGNEARYVKEDWVDPARVGILLAVHARLYSTLLKYWWVVERYAMETVQYTPSASDALRHYDSNTLALLTFPGLNFERGEQREIEAALFQAKWVGTRAEAALIKPSYSSTSASEALQCLIRLNFHAAALPNDPAAFRTRAPRREHDAPFLVRASGSLKEIPFFAYSGDFFNHNNNPLERVFTDTLETHPRHCLGVVEAFAPLVDALEGNSLDEAPGLGEWATVTVEAMMGRVQARFEGLIDALFLESMRLADQTHPLRAAERLVMKRSKKEGHINNNNNNGGVATTNVVSTVNASTVAMTGSNALTLQTDGGPNADPHATTTTAASSSSSSNKDPLYRMRPGNESFFENTRETLPALEAARRGVRGMAACLSSRVFPTLVVWDRVYAPREYLRESLVAWLDRRLRLLSLSGPGALQRPSLIARHSLAAMETVRFACLHAGLDHVHIQRCASVRLHFNSSSHALGSGGAAGSGMSTALIASDAPVNRTIRRTVSQTSSSSNSLISPLSTLSVVELVASWLIHFVENVLGVTSYDALSSKRGGGGGGGGGVSGEIVYSRLFEGFARVNELSSNASVGAAATPSSSSSSLTGSAMNIPINSSSSSLGSSANPIMSVSASSASLSSSSSLVGGGFAPAPDFTTTASAFRAEMFLDAREMDALVEILGVKGTRGVETSLISQLVVPHAQALKLALTDKDFQTWIAPFAKCCRRGEAGALRALLLPPPSSAASAAVSNVIVASRAIGTAFALIDMLRAALARVVGEMDLVEAAEAVAELDDYANAIKRAFSSQTSEGGKQPPVASHHSMRALAALDFLNVSRFPRAALVAALEPILPTAQVMGDTLPYAIAASIATVPEFWRQADFSLRLDAHLNNAHLAGLGAVRLLELRGGGGGAIEMMRACFACAAEVRQSREVMGKDNYVRGALCFVEKLAEYASSGENGGDTFSSAANAPARMCRAAGIPPHVLTQCRLDLALNKNGLRPEQFANVVLTDASGGGYPPSSSYSSSATAASSSATAVAVSVAGGAAALLLQQPQRVVSALDNRRRSLINFRG